VASGAGVDRTVDANAIPLIAIDRVEILAGDGSALYGSGAAAGVVNLVTRSEFRGAEASLYTATTSRGDGITYDLSAIAGHRTDGGLARAMIAAEVQRQHPVMASDRAFSRSLERYDFPTQMAVPGGSGITPGGRFDAWNLAPNGAPVTCGAGVRYCTSDGAGG